MKISTVINFTLFHFLWPACIFGAANGLIWPGLLLLLVFMCWHHFSGNAVSGDWKLLLTMFVIGMLVDTLWLQTGVLGYAMTWPSAQIAPIWIGVLWMGFALALNHSLAWMQKRKWLAGALLIIGSPFSYYCAAKFGAVQWLATDWQVIAAVGLSWFLLIPFFLTLAEYWNRQTVISE